MKMRRKRRGEKEGKGEGKEEEKTRTLMLYLVILKYCSHLSQTSIESILTSKPPKICQKYANKQLN